MQCLRREKGGWERAAEEVGLRHRDVYCVKDRTETLGLLASAKRLVIADIHFFIVAVCK